MSMYQQNFALRGMSQDISQMYYSEETSPYNAFENYNIRFEATDKNNSLFVGKNEKGNTPRNIEIYGDMEYTGEFTYGGQGVPFIVIGQCVIDKYLVLFGTDNEFDYILRLEYVNGEYKGVYLMDSQKLNFSTEYPIEAHPYIETNLIKKVYFVDGHNSPRVINVVDENAINNIADLNLGAYLQLNEEMTVTRINKFGNLPGGKIQFAFSYGNDLESLTGLVDYSPLYDCTRNHTGIAPDADVEHKYADHSFNVTINNIDSQFKWIRLYMFIRTSLDGTPVIYYVNRYINNKNSFSWNVNLADEDVVLATETFQDILDRGSIRLIPKTMSIFENRIFYGNNKVKDYEINKLFSDPDKTYVNAEQVLRTIGVEESDDDRVYTYDPEKISFSGSSFDNKGFRCGNWYKFGIIAQDKYGTWSEVIPISEPIQCTKHSNVIYDIMFNTSTIQNVHFEITFTDDGLEELQKLHDMGFEKIKPVCVCPNPAQRTVISQGIVNPTVYKGGSRLSQNTGMFAMPSWFFRPKRGLLWTDTNDFKYLSDLTITDVEGGDETIQPVYPYTIRSVRDLNLAGNTVLNDSYYTNPPFDAITNDLCHYNVNYREYRHGFSLPPKDRINAELECSEYSINEYFLGPLEGDDNRPGLTSEQLLSMSILDDSEYPEYRITNFDSDSTDDTFKFGLKNRILRQTNDNNFNYPSSTFSAITLRPIIEPKGYANTVFIDESICTFNAPEIDYISVGGNLNTNVLIPTDDYNMSVVGYASITKSQSDIQIDSTQYNVGTKVKGGVQYNIGDETVTGTCITHQSVIDKCPEIKQLFKSTSNNRFACTSGPFWFDKLLVLGYSTRSGDVSSRMYSDNKTYYFDTKEFDELKDADGNLFIGPDTGGELNSGAYRRIGRTFFNGYQSFVPACYGELCDRSLPDRFDFDLSTHFVLLRNNKFESKGKIALFTDAILPNDYTISDLDIPSDTWNEDDEDNFKTYCILGLIYNTRPISFYNFLYDVSDEEDLLHFQHTNTIDNIEVTRGIINNTRKYYLFSMNRAPITVPWKSSSNHFIGSEYGSHYYLKNSTAFPSSLFEPYYAHTVYPFMHLNSNIPFCGTSTLYESTDCRPKYNFTCSLLYSNKSTYLESSLDYTNTKTYYYSYKDIPFNPSYLTSSSNSKKYGLSEQILYNTNSLVAATKWYRGWKTVVEKDDESQLQFSLGNRINKSSIFGNLAFSGNLPQLFTKSGRIHFSYAQTQPTHQINSIHNSIQNFKEIAKGMPQIISFQDMIASPHLVYYDETGHILPEFSNYELSQYYKLNIHFRNQFYFKDFVYLDNMYNRASNDSDYRNPILTSNSFDYANFHIYPHSGNWIPIPIPKSTYSSRAYWQKVLDIDSISIEPVGTVNQSQVMIDDIEDYDSWNLFLADYINTQYKYDSPYLDDNVEYSMWKPCGPSIKLNNITDDSVVRFDEGDTYFMRYNCLKTVLPNDPIANEVKNGISECASVYIESYINLDGRYDDYDKLSNDDGYVMHATLNDISKINAVYSQDNNLFTYGQVNYNYTSSYLKEYPTNIAWTPMKINGEDFDSWSVVPGTNSFNVDGTYGPITNLLHLPSHQIACIQEHGVSILNINPTGVIASDNGSIQIQNNVKDASVLTQTRYISREYGSQNKWSSVETPSGVFFIDTFKKDIFKLNSDGLSGISSLGFKTWCNTHFNIDNCEWNVSYFLNNNNENAFVTYYDSKYNDVYFINNKYCLAFNASRNIFTSFYAYENVPYILNYLDNTYSLYYNDLFTGFYQQYTDYSNKFYKTPIGYYIKLLANENPTYDKVYNFITYSDEVFDDTGTVIPLQNGFNYISVLNYYQEGHEFLDLHNTRQKFRTWRSEIPRANMNERIRGQWSYIKLGYEPTDSNSTMENKLYSLGVNYSILEQPMTITKQ